MAPNLDEVADELIRNEDPVVTAPEVADALDCSRKHALDQLRLLERAGDVASKDIGAAAVAWWHEERVCPPRVPPEEHPDQAALEDAGEPRPRERPENRRESDGETVGTVDLPGEGNVEGDRRNALAFAVEFVREQGEARAGEIREAVHEQRETHNETARSAWKNWIQPAFSEIEEVELKNRSRGLWAPRGEQ